MLQFCKIYFKNLFCLSKSNFVITLEASYWPSNDNQAFFVERAIFWPIRCCYKKEKIGQFAIKNAFWVLWLKIAMFQIWSIVTERPFAGTFNLVANIGPFMNLVWCCHVKHINFVCFDCLFTFYCFCIPAQNFLPDHGCGSGTRPEVWHQWWKWDQDLRTRINLYSRGPNSCCNTHLSWSNGNWCQSGSYGCHLTEKTAEKVSDIENC